MTGRGNPKILNLKVVLLLVTIVAKTSDLYCKLIWL